MKRIFIAIDISDETRRQVSHYITDLRAAFPNVRAGWDKPEKLHLTVKFLGDLNEIQLDNLIEAVNATVKQISEFGIGISKTGVFPSKKNARILWLGIEDENGSMQKLNEILETECERKGFAREKRNFKAHLTIARLREPHKSKALVERHLQNDFESDEFEVAELVVYESLLQKSGSVYLIISKHKFKRAE
jgi:RNA 2',3'-cyclic 3'-phosphodiesterase